ncbi:rho GTPase-activating protein 7-like [Uloborus diversus]|uniref:rho GTPase-activating protein 7-like n=1 Tax=Uloborus diversus TaxID=327109 RepID=UPI002409838D|nr:rho GTPase-activating protein 7-like [Uloborus diversus]
MTACHDPYKELEFYLKEAEDEIGRAIQELEEQEETGLVDPCSKAKPNDVLLPPPQEFQSRISCDAFETSSLSSSTSSSTLNRVCHDGNTVDFKNSSDKLNSINDNNPLKTCFSSCLSPGTLGRRGKLSYSPNTRRRLWQMHPSLSFPETSKDLLLLGTKITSSSENHSGKLCNGDPANVYGTNHESRTFAHSCTNVRQRSSSDTLVPFTVRSEPDDQFRFPTPPSGDVNLLSIWANNLVLELDKTFSSEFNSVSSISPSSDYSLSPTKPDDSLDVDNGISNFRETKSDSVDLRSEQFFNRSLKVVSMSPDSGIDQTIEMTGDCVGSCNCKQKLVINCDYTVPNYCVDQITPPPPEFDDIHASDEVFLDSNSQAAKNYRNGPFPWVSILNGAVPICEVPESLEIVENTVQDVGVHAHYVASRTVQLNDYAVVQTTCCVNGISEFEQQSESKKMGAGSVNMGYHTVASSPKSKKTIPNGIKKWSCTLPREPGKNEDIIPFYRSVSQDAVTSIADVSIEELAAFMQRMKSELQLNPSCADVSTDVNDDSEIKDADTQTTPLPLSRSSSFTWVTECDCSDWDTNNLNSGSEESLFMAQCSNCQRDGRNQKSTSSSSIGVSSGDDECPASPGSGSSSLYLSACSGSTDSFEEATTSVDGQLEQIKSSDDSKVQNGRRPQRGSETTLLRGSTLGDISEEQVTSESISIKSTISNPSLSDANNTDMAGQSASFPSTLKVTRRNRSTGSPAQPIEPTVLIINELNLKSVSAPVLRQKRNISKSVESSSSDSSPPTGTRSKDSSNGGVPGQIPAKSHSAKELNELQAIEACSWLRAAGFPQYAQMYEDNQFPIDISIVQNDHAFLPPDSIQSLFRRLNTLNRCAKMKFMDHSHRKSLRTEESDEEEQYALSENWEFQRSSRRWSRIPPTSEGIIDSIPTDPPAPARPSGNLLTAPSRQYLSPEEAYCSSHDSVFIDEQHSSPESIRRGSVIKSEKGCISPTGYVGDCSPGSSSGSGGTISVASEDMLERKNLRRSGSDRVKEGAKALLRRMESLKGKRKKKVETKEVESVNIAQSATDGSSSGSLTSSPQFRRSQRYAGESQKKSDTLHVKTSAPNAHSDPESSLSFPSDKWKDANSNTKYFKYCAVKTAVTITAPDETPSGCEEDRNSFLKSDAKSKKSLLHPSSAVQDKETCDNRGSYYDNITAPIVIFNDLCTANLDYSPQHQGDAQSGSVSPIGASSSNQDEEIIIVNTERRDSGVGSSLTRGITYQQAPWHCFPVHPSETKSLPSPVQVTDLTAPQMLLLRKLSLLKLTTLMEKYSPTSRTGWSWAVPKLFRRNRSTDYKDKVVFGVPLLMILQRTGQPLPSSIQAAIHYLRETALDASGLFRKSGVRSRIQKLKSMNESDPEKINYEEQQAYDVADMLKQYFRELPEALLTNKLSETFISIFQYIPAELRLEAIQAALMLMPDENREVLQALLEFLHEVCQHSGINQMTATNLAVCFAPSIFHLSTPRSTSSSPRRRKTVGAPDMKELNENRAAYECLSCMVSNYLYLFSISDEMISQSRISSTIHYHPATMEEYSSFVYSDQTGLKSYFDNCIQIFLKESREKYKGWINVCQYDHVDLSYKKLADGHPLRLWKVSTEVEAPPVELLNRVLRERHLWDSSFTKWKVVSRINAQTEVFQYLNVSLPPHPPCDYSVLRNWRTDLPKGACILVETSVKYPEAEITSGSVRALMLASRYLIEPCGAGKSRVTHISRVDTRGRSPEWYNRAYGHICIQLLIKLRSSFSRSGTDGPETKV